MNLIKSFLISMPASMLILFSGFAGAQTSDSLVAGKIEFFEPRGLSEMMSNYKYHNAEKSETDGFRVQIFLSSGNNSRNSANVVLNAFKSNFPEIPAYLSYQQPNFKVRVGDCDTKLKARKIQKLISSKYPQAFIIRDKIKISRPAED